MQEIKKKILVIDDDPEVARAINDVLTRCGYEVYVAANGEEGVGLLKKNKPDLVFLDLVLPDQSGFQVAKKIKSINAHRDTPLIAISLKKDNVDKHVAAKSGFLAYLEKPIDNQALLFQANDILKSSKKQKE